MANMESLVLTSPTILRIPEKFATQAKDALGYEDKKVTYEWLRLFRILEQDNAWISSGQRGYRHWWFNSRSREELELAVSRLNAERYKSLLFKDEQGYFTYSGLASTLSKLLNIPVERRFDPPEFGLVGWENKPFDPRPYQTKSLDLLVPEDYSRNHGAIQVGTGLGKSLIIAMVLKRIGLPAVIVVPKVNIAEQLTKSLEEWFGRRLVGTFYSGKKKPDKMFVVAVAASLINVEEGTKDYKSLSGKKVLICDESHMVPAESLAKVALGLFSDVPYRYFFSGTQIRGDGLELLLEGIIGDIVFEMTVKQGIEEGYLSPLKFFQWNITSDADLDCEDGIKMNRTHLHYNKKVNRHAVKLAKYAVSKGRRVLILIDEIEQFVLLAKAGLLDLRVAFAHGPLNTEQKKILPVAFHKSEPLKLVEKYDAGEYDVLVGTSCVQTGTDIKSASCIINLFGLSSEIQIRQGVIGRGTRLHLTKTDCVINDYNVQNIDKLAKHAKIRKRIFNETYGKCICLDAK